jgi:hypothetical protein
VGKLITLKFGLAAGEHGRRGWGTLASAGQKEEAGEVVGRVHGGGDEQRSKESWSAYTPRSLAPVHRPASPDFFRIENTRRNRADEMLLLIPAAAALVMGERHKQSHPATESVPSYSFTKSSRAPADCLLLSSPV